MTEDAPVAIVTGGNAGIGKATVLELAQQGFHVALVSRDLDKGMAAAEEIRRETGSQSVDVVQGSLSSIEQTRALADALLAAYPRIDLLINNAGVWMSERTLNADGLEVTFMVNHVAPFLLTTLLLDRLKESAPARIVNVNAGLYVNGAMDLEVLPEGKNFSRFKTYMHSKLCNILFTLELAKRLDGTNVEVTALHPGVINTNLGNTRGALGAVLTTMKRFWGKPEDAGMAVAHVATTSAPVNGKYFDVTKETPIAENAQDPALAEALWNYTNALVGRHSER